jgi:hypothetical protein
MVHGDCFGLAFFTMPGRSLAAILPLYCTRAPPPAFLPLHLSSTNCHTTSVHRCVCLAASVPLRRHLAPGAVINRPLPLSLHRAWSASSLGDGIQRCVRDGQGCLAQQW